MEPTISDEVRALLGPWSGPYGGLPPFDKATPALIEAAAEIAIAEKRHEIAAIFADNSPPSFANTIEAMEASGRALRRVNSLFQVFNSTMATPAMRDVAQRIAPKIAALDDEIDLNAAFYARVDAVYRARQTSGLTDEQQQLIAMIRDRMRRRGAGLAEDQKQTLSEINARLAFLEMTFLQNMIAEQDEQAIFLDDPSDLDGLDDASIQGAAAAAAEKQQPGRWAIPNRRPSVWPVITLCKNRDLRERAWRMWISRGSHDGAWDNRPVITEIMRLRGEKARLLGFPSFAHFATDGRMAGAPEVAMDAMLRVWDRVLAKTNEQLAELQPLAAADGVESELEPWDRRYYAEKYRQARFGLDAEVVKSYLQLDVILEGMLWAAEQTFNVSFTPLPDAPRVDPSIKVFEVSRSGAPVGVVWFDLINRPGKSMGSWSASYRDHESFRGEVLPMGAVYSNLKPSLDGAPIQIGWEYANVLFHEVGHLMHGILCGASYPSLCHTGVPWDFVELPSLLNERWFMSSEVLERFTRHATTGEKMPADLIVALDKGIKFDRVFSLGLDFLIGAIVDMKIHLIADGRDVDALQVARDTEQELGMPRAMDWILPLTNAMHMFAGPYAAGLYSYLWGEIMAADAAEAFLDAPGGFFDKPVAQRWLDTVLTVGASVPSAQAFRNFRGHDPDPDALLRRFGLDEAA